MQSLIDGFVQFRTQVFPSERQRFRALANQQSPLALFITCADSRIVPNLITQARPGELFICRTVGNQVPVYGSINDGVSSSIEYAVQALNVKDVIVCGHSDCGAMKAILEPGKLSNLPATAAWLKQSYKLRSLVVGDQRDEQRQPEGVELPLLAEKNVMAQIENLKTHPAVASRIERGGLGLHGWIYHIHSGDITCYDSRQESFVPLDRKPHQMALGGAA